MNDFSSPLHPLNPLNPLSPLNPGHPIHHMRDDRPKSVREAQAYEQATEKPWTPEHTERALVLGGMAFFFVTQVVILLVIVNVFFKDKK